LRAFLALIFYIVLIVNLDFFPSESFSSIFYHGFALITSVLVACILTRKNLPIKIPSIGTILVVLVFFVIYKSCQVFIQGNYNLHSGLSDYWMVFVSIGLVSVGEELFFRGVLFDDVKEKFNTKIAILASISFFVVMHSFDTSIINLMTFTLISAIAFTYLRVKYQSVIIPLLAHVVGNYTVFFLINGT
jgi:membrane protease YdiL (CAAX protease family)